MDTTQLVLLIVGGVLLVCGFVTAMVLFVMYLMKTLGGKAGGWRTLAATFPTTIEPSERSFLGETAQIGAVVYKRCVTLAAMHAGLYVKIWGKSALIPWKEIKGVGAATLYWQQMPMLTIGDPPLATIVVAKGVYDQITPHIAPKLVSDG